jgi:hypothetical protein
MDVSITIPAQTVTIPTQSVDVTIPAAQIVYQNSWLGLTSHLSSTTILTAPSDGLYRVSIGANVASGGAVNFTLSCPDANSIIGSFGYGNQTLQSGTYAVFVPSGQSISLSSIIVSSSATYSLYVTIEQLQ